VLSDLGRAAGATAGRVTELPREGTDTIVTRGDPRLTLPPNVERARAKGAGGVALVGSDTADEVLIGAGGDDTLAGRVGSDEVRGRGGDDEILLGAFGFDRARGGKGADRFRVLNAPPPDPKFPIGADPGSAASAHAIEDLDPSEGDRLILSTRRFGKGLSKLRDHLRVTRGAEARGDGPQLLFRGGSGLLSFDRDGRGGAEAMVIAILEGHDHVPRRAIEISVND
jgi:Ca2+-binding RTX toxin-like protein